MDWRRLSPSEKTIALTGPVLFASSFVRGWATFDGLGVSFSLWSTFGIPQRLGIAALLMAAVLAFSRAASKEIVPTPGAYLKLSAAGAVLLVLGILLGPGTGFGRGVLLYAATAIALGQTYAGFVYLQENRRLPRAVRRATIGRRRAA